MRRFLFSALPLLLCAAASAQSVEHWTIDGVAREALIYAPAHGSAKCPVVFAFHGHGGNMTAAAQSMHFQDAWPQAIVVYPQGLPTPSMVDPQGLRPGWQRDPGQLGDRDLKLFDAILATLRSKYHVDDDRVYATGFSNGAVFTFLLWGERGQTLAGLGACAGVIPSTVSVTTPRGVIHIAGEADQTAPFAMQLQTMQQERTINACSANGHPCGPGCTRYESPKHTPVVNVLHHGGHVYPPWATQRIVRFLRTQTR